MSGPVIVAIILPIVLAVALTIWIAAVFQANRHPEPGQGMLIGWLARRTRIRQPGRQVAPQQTLHGQSPDDQDGAGGATPAVSQGQQQEPIRRHR